MSTRESKQTEFMSIIKMVQNGVIEKVVEEKLTEFQNLYPTFCKNEENYIEINKLFAEACGREYFDIGRDLVAYADPNSILSFGVKFTKRAATEILDTFDDLHPKVYFNLLQLVHADSTRITEKHEV